MSEGQLLLEIRDLEVSFDGFKANAEVNLDVLEGELRFLIGPNGAGKTTLIDAITGLIKPSKGTHHLRRPGTCCSAGSSRSSGWGSGRTFQKANVFEELTVVENLDLAASFRRTLSPGCSAGAAACCPRCIEALDIVGLPAYADRPAGVLSHGQKQWLEIGMLLVQNPMLLLLDEPVAGMSKSERTKTGELLQLIAQTKTLMVIEHDMDFVRRFSNKVTVLHEGRILCEGPIEEVQAEPHGAGGLPGPGPRPPVTGGGDRLMLSVREHRRGLRAHPDPLRGRHGGIQQRTVLRHGPQRRGQDHIAERHHGGSQAGIGQDPFRGKGPRQDAPLRTGQGRTCLRSPEPGAASRSSRCWRA